MPRTSSQSRRFALSSYKRETPYGTPPTVNSTNYSEMFGFTSPPAAFPDKTESNADTITGSPKGLPTEQQIIVPKVELEYAESRGHPNALATLLALGLGAPSASVQDGGLQAYRHRWYLPTPGADALSGAAVELTGTQRIYPGVNAKSIMLEGGASPEPGLLSLKGSLMGNGSRATNADAWPAKIAEPWLNMAHMSAWLEVGGSRSISATPTQGAENISSGAGISIKDRISKFAFGLEDLVVQDWGIGGGGSGFVNKAFYGPQPKVKLSLTMAWADATEMDYLNQNDLAFEFDLTHPTQLIAGGGTYYYGMSLIIPNCRLKPITRTGNVGEFISQDLDIEVIDDLVNEPVIIYVYTSKATYLAA